MNKFLSIFASFALFVGAVAFTHAQIPVTGAGLGAPKVSGGGCSPATTFLARTSGVSAGDQTAVTNFMCGLVTDGLFTSAATGYCTTNFDVIYLHAITNSTTALLNLCSASFTGTANGSPTFTADAGFTGVDASSTVFIDTGFNPSTAGGNFSQNSAHISAWSLTNATSSLAGGAVIGLTDTAKSTRIFPKFNDGGLYGDANNSTNNSPIANANSTGHYLINRSGASATQSYRNGSSIGSASATSSANANANVYVLAFDAIPSGAGFGGGYQIAMASIGANLNSTQVGNFCHRLNVYLTAVGAASAGIC